MLRGVSNSKLYCPQCGRPASKVARTTLEHLLRPEARHEIADEPYFVCTQPGCTTVYFTATGSQFHTKALTVPFGLKAGARGKICYCFDHSIEEIDNEIAATGGSKVVERIKADMKGPGCRCEVTNPIGKCCLASVQNVVRARLSESASHPTLAQSAPRRAGALAACGSVGVAVASSACCWLPLVLLAIGASAAGVAGFFERWRLPLVALAALLLVGAFVLVLRKPANHTKDCCKPARRGQPAQLAMLCLATLLVLASASFPNYATYLIAAPSNNAVDAGFVHRAAELLVPIEGMTCGGCSTLVERQIGQIPGVLAVQSSYEASLARVQVSTDEPALRAAIVRAVKDVGFETEPDRIHK